MIPLDFSGRTALVTGAAGGIGRGIVAALREAGAVVVAADRESGALESLYAHTDKVHTAAFDITDEEAVQAAAADIAGRVAPVTLLVNNAGVATRVGLPFTRLEACDWSLPWEVNVVGIFTCSKAFAPQMIEAGRGSIVNIASVSGRTGFQTSPPYSATKAAVINFTQVMARDLAKHRIRVNAVCPGMVFTPFYKQQRLAAAEADPKLLEVSDEDYFNDKAERLIPLGHGQKPEDIARAVCFLASDLAASITGQSLNVDGGLVDVMKSFPSYVGHNWIEPGERTITVENPATGKAFAKMPKLGAAEVDRAMRAATEAQHVWAEQPPTERAEVLRRAGDLLEARSDEIARDLATEGGRPPKEARGEIAKSVTTFRYYAGLVGALDGRTFAGSASQQRHETRREPIGVVVAITPWNVPAASPARKLAPALLAGNAVVLKPASATPVSAYHLTKLLLEAGLPPGTAQLVTGSGGEVGQALALHADTAAVSFTGSTEVGLTLQESLADRLTRVQLELGGKNAAIVLPDADLGNAVKQIVAASFASSGQQCTATSRVIVLREVSEAFCEELKRQTEALKVGATTDDATDMGPLISENQLKQTRAFVERALAEGADLVTGGHVLEQPGYFYAPTVITNVGRDFEVAREEVFGPLLSVLVVDTLDEAVEVINDTVYGLSAAVHTRDIGAAQRIVARTNAGVVAVNGPTAGIELAAPFGGFKLSGTASKEHGPESLDFYTRLKLVSWRWT